MKAKLFKVVQQRLAGVAQACAVFNMFVVHAMKE